MTNRQFAMNVMDPGEVNAFIRMWETWLKKVEKEGEPIWIKEMRYDEFMDAEFSPTLWEDACTPKSAGTVPPDFMKSIKGAYRFANRDPKKKKDGKKEPTLHQIDSFDKTKFKYKSVKLA